MYFSFILAIPTIEDDAAGFVVDLTLCFHASLALITMMKDFSFAQIILFFHTPKRDSWNYAIGNCVSY